MDKKIIEQNLIKEMGLENLPPEEKEKLIATFSETIFKAIWLQAALGLDQEKQDEFSKLIEHNDDEGIGKFLAQNVPNIEDITTEEIAKFKQAMLAHSQKIDEQFKKTTPATAY